MPINPLFFDKDYLENHKLLEWSSMAAMVLGAAGILYAYAHPKTVKSLAAGFRKEALDAIHWANYSLGNAANFVNDNRLETLLGAAAVATAGGAAWGLSKPQVRKAVGNGISAAYHGVSGVVNAAGYNASVGVGSLVLGSSSLAKRGFSGAVNRVKRVRNRRQRQVHKMSLSEAPGVEAQSPVQPQISSKAALDYRRDYRNVVPAAFRSMSGWYRVTPLRPFFNLLPQGKGQSTLVPPHNDLEAAVDGAHEMLSPDFALPPAGYAAAPAGSNGVSSGSVLGMLPKPEGRLAVAARHAVHAARVAAAVAGGSLAGAWLAGVALAYPYIYYGPLDHRLEVMIIAAGGVAGAAAGSLVAPQVRNSVRHGISKAYHGISGAFLNEAGTAMSEAGKAVHDLAAVLQRKLSPPRIRHRTPSPAPAYQQGSDSASLEAALSASPAARNPEHVFKIPTMKPWQIAVGVLVLGGVLALNVFVYPKYLPFEKPAQPAKSTAPPAVSSPQALDSVVGPTLVPYVPPATPTQGYATQTQVSTSTPMPPTLAPTATMQPQPTYAATVQAETKTEIQITELPQYLLNSPGPVVIRLYHSEECAAKLEDRIRITTRDKSGEVVDDINFEGNKQYLIDFAAVFGYEPSSLRQLILYDGNCEGVEFHTTPERGHDNRTDLHQSLKFSSAMPEIAEVLKNRPDLIIESLLADSAKERYAGVAVGGR